MPAMTIRNISTETHRALKSRAERHGRSTEAEVRQILDQAVQGSSDGKMGDWFEGLAQKLDITEEDHLALEAALAANREETSPEPVRFE